MVTARERAARAEKARRERGRPPRSRAGDGGGAGALNPPRAPPSVGGLSARRGEKETREIGEPVEAAYVPGRKSLSGGAARRSVASSTMTSRTSETEEAAQA